MQYIFCIIAKKLWPFPRIIAHRGGGDCAPENTILGIETGKRYGIPAVEFDVMLSKDDVPMLMHDEILERTVTDSSLIGTVFNSLNSKELQTINVGKYFNSNDTTTFIPTFEEVLEYCLKEQIFMNIEIKPAEGKDIITSRIVAEKTLQYYSHLAEVGVAPMFSSFSFDALKVAKETAPSIPRGYLIHEPLDTVPNWKEQASELEVTALHLNHEHLTRSLVEEIKSMKYGIFVYTVNTIERARELLSWGVDCLCTDNIQDFSHLALELAD